MTVRFPALPRRGLGVGMDMPWDGERGFAAGDRLAPAVSAFLRAEAPGWSHAFFSFQARDRAPLRVDGYARAWDELRSALPAGLPVGLHHTALDLGAVARRERDGLLAFTGDLCRRCDLRWVNEDVGLWSLGGRPLPYPLPPPLTEGGLRAAILNVRTCAAALPVPLVLEFPGFSRGASVVCGDFDAYDFFRALAEETGSPVTLDVGHLLSWRWWRGLRGPALLDDLGRLPLSHCCELHLSGCEIDGDRFVDAHHGRLLDDQFELCARLLSRCPNLRAVTYEDPRLTDRGALVEDNVPSWRRLVELVTPWARA